MKNMKRRAMLSLGVVAVLLAATAACLVYRDARPTALPAVSEQVTAIETDPLTEFRTERQQLRERQRAELQDIIHDAATDADTLSLAKRQLMSLMDREDKELTLEGLLTARGFEDALVTVDVGAVNVLVRGAALTQRETAVILDLALRQTGVTSGNVKIIPIN
ncbi:MAG: SpoIIIAH-like family protein [Clostridia bacterium]|nr:SpoIIIAH-like family protein [Clostridia bacterium]